MKMSSQLLKLLSLLFSILASSTKILGLLADFFMVEPYADFCFDKKLIVWFKKSKNMRNSALLLIVVALLSIATHSNNSASGRLSPLIPPTAFVQNFYTCQFRVIGLDFPQYTFQGLPPTITGTSEGRVSGTPNQTGSYPVTVSYQSNGYKASSEFIFRVTQPIWTISDIFPAAPPSPVYIYLQQNTTMFMIGEEINLKAACVGGKPPYVWAYLRLPEQLVGNKNGVIRGEIFVDGSYSFGVTCADSEGLSADIFINLNVQPMVFFSRYTINPVYVENKNQPTEYDWECVNKVQEETFKAFDYFFSKVESKKIQYNQLKIMMTQFQDAVKVAGNKVKASIQNVSNVQALVERTSIKVSGAQSAITQIKRSCQRVIENFEKVKADFNEAEQVLKKKKEKADSSAAILTKASDQLIKSQTETSQAAQHYQKVSLELEQRKLEVDYNLNSVLSSKTNLQKARVSLELMTNNVTSSTNNKITKKTDNQEATSLFQAAQNKSEQTTSQMEEAIMKVATIRKDLKDMELKLGTSKFKLQQAENKLMVAQAFKAEVDKLKQIAKMYQKDQQKKEFAGCDCLGYPSTAGSVQIAELLPNGVYLASGQTLLWGSCTKKSTCKKGDVIFFQAYLKEGCLHAVTVQVISTLA